jgi:CRP-like cAMP-binding protein
MADARVEHVHFPLSGVISPVVTMQDGRGVDAATVGFEGVVGASLALGEELSPYDIIVQVEGEAHRVPARDFQVLVAEDRALREVMLRFAQVLLLQTSRTAACNRLHEVTERLARWLLLTHDWVEGDRFRLTHDTLATMLGVHRPSVTIAAGALMRAGFITYRRGEIRVVDRAGLEAASCEDYAAIRERFDRLFTSAAAAD